MRILTEKQYRRLVNTISRQREELKTNRKVEIIEIVDRRTKEANDYFKPF